MYYIAENALRTGFGIDARIVEILVHNILVFIMVVVVNLVTSTQPGPKPW